MRVECPFCKTVYKIEVSCVVRCSMCNGRFAVRVEYPGGVHYTDTYGNPAVHYPEDGPFMIGAAHCVYHPGTPAVTVCEKCYKAVCRFCASNIRGVNTCYVCAPDVSKALSWVPMEDPERHGPLTRYFSTVIKILFSPSRFFGGVPGGRNAG